MNALRYVGKNACHEESYREVIGGKQPDTVVLDLVSNCPNIVLRATLNEAPLYLNASALIRDFRDIGVMTYILDTLARRDGGVDYWSRDFKCTFPVREPDLWSSNSNRLSRVLATVAGDQYTFDWLSSGALPAQAGHNTHIPRGYDAVCLFSGGIDSLLGAHKLLSEGKRLLLVGHQSEGTTAAAQKALFRQLNRLFPGRALLIQFRVSVSKREQPLFQLPNINEDTHRARSFLFLTLAITIANMAKVQSIYMPENGLIALNAPLDASRLGTCSTRTAHPRFLMQFLDFASALGAYTGSLNNPFLHESKTDMLLSFDPRLKPALLRSVSCSRPNRYQNKHVRHCGYCVPCIYRRAAFASCGIDIASEYAFDVFDNLATLTEIKQRDLVALFRFARKYQVLTPLKQQSVVLAQGYFDPHISGQIGPRDASDYSPWVKMLDRWTRDFLSLIDRKAPSSTKAYLRCQQSSAN